MRRDRLLIFLVVTFLFIFLDIICVNAALPSSFSGVAQVGSQVWDQCGNTKIDDEGNEVPNCYAMPLKKATINGNNVAVICTKYYGSVPAGQTCTKDDWNDNVRYGVAAVINAAKSNINTTSLTTEYFVAEMAINKFVYDKTSGSGGADIHVTSLSSTKQTLFNNYISKANSAYDNYSTDSSVSISLSSSTLTFTLNGSNYESNSVTVSGISDYSVSSNVGTVSKTGNSFKIIVSAESVTSITTVTATVTASKQIELASNYDCGSSYQTLTPILLDTVTTTDKALATGTIIPLGKLTIKKVDGDNKNLAGAKIKVTGPNNYSNEITTTSADIVLENLEYGTYTIEEIETPDGYVTAIKQTVTLDKENLIKTITLVNNKTKIQISKLDVTNKEELPGATLEIQDEDGNIVKYCTDEEGNTNAECKWISTEEPYIIEGLPIGKYYLVETMAPEGYVLNQEKIEFEIKDDETTVEVEMVNELEVEVPNTLSSKSPLLLTIAMFDVALGIGILIYVKKNKIEGN